MDANLIPILHVKRSILRIIAPHANIDLGSYSFLDTCRHMKNCNYVHYKLDPTLDVPPMIMGIAFLALPKRMKSQHVEYCLEVELGEPQWINCDICTFRMDILRQFRVIMVDQPWDIHMELPYGTMADDELHNLSVHILQTDGLIFFWSLDTLWSLDENVQNCRNQKLRGNLEFFNSNSVRSTHHQQSSHLAPWAPLLHGHAWQPSSAPSIG